MRSLIVVVSLVAGWVGLGCKAEGEATEIMLLVNTNLEPSGGLERIRIRVLRADPEGASGIPDTPVPPSLDAARGDRVVVEGEPYEHRWVSEVTFGSGTIGILPLTLGLVPEAGDDARLRYYFEAFALGAGDAIITRIAARTAFVPRHRVSVYLWLTDACVGKTCPSEQTCWFGECIDVERPDECHTAAGMDAGLGTVLPCDAGRGRATFDGGADASADGGADASADGGVDAGTSCVCSGTGWQSCGTRCEARRCDGCRWGGCVDNAGRGCSDGASCVCTTAAGYDGNRFCPLGGGTWGTGCCVLPYGGCGSSDDCCNRWPCQAGRCCTPTGRTGCTIDQHCCSGTCSGGTCI